MALKFYGFLFPSHFIGQLGKMIFSETGVSAEIGMDISTCYQGIDKAYMMFLKGSSFTACSHLEPTKLDHPLLMFS